MGHIDTAKDSCEILHDGAHISQFESYGQVCGRGQVLPYRRGAQVIRNGSLFVRAVVGKLVTIHFLRTLKSPSLLLISTKDKNTDIVQIWIYALLSCFSSHKYLDDYSLPTPDI